MSNFLIGPRISTCKKNCKNVLHITYVLTSASLDCLWLTSCLPIGASCCRVLRLLVSARVSRANLVHPEKMRSQLLPKSQSLHFNWSYHLCQLILYELHKHNQTPGSCMLPLPMQFPCSKLTAVHQIFTKCCLLNHRVFIAKQHSLL